MDVVGLPCPAAPEGIHVLALEVVGIERIGSAIVGDVNGDIVGCALVGSHLDANLIDGGYVTAALLQEVHAQVVGFASLQLECAEGQTLAGSPTAGIADGLCQGRVGIASLQACQVNIHAESNRTAVFFGSVCGKRLIDAIEVGHYLVDNVGIFLDVADFAAILVYGDSAARSLILVQAEDNLTACHQVGVGSDGDGGAADATGSRIAVDGSRQIFCGDVSIQIRLTAYHLR